MRLAIAVHEKRRRGGEKPRPPKAPANPDVRQIPTAVKREVWTRDGACCAFIGVDGKRCGSRHQVEFHHVIAAANLGPPTVENISLRCRSHNVYEAELEFGRYSPWARASRAG